MTTNTIYYNIKRQFSAVSFMFGFCTAFGVSRVICDAHLRSLTPWATQLPSQWTLHWAPRVNCQLAPTHQRRARGWPVLFFKTSVRPDRELNPTCRFGGASSSNCATLPVLRFVPKNPTCYKEPRFERSLLWKTALRPNFCQQYSIFCRFLWTPSANRNASATIEQVWSPTQHSDVLRAKCSARA